MKANLFPSGEKIGNASVFLGAGRFSKEDTIDYSAGLIIHKKLGDFVKRGVKLATLYYNSENYLKQAVDLIENAYTISSEYTTQFKLIHDAIQ